MTELTLQIDGMSCDHCVRRVTKVLEGAFGGASTGASGTAPAGAGLAGIVKQVRVGSATVDYDGRPESLDAILQALDRAGYSARPASETVRS